MSLLGLVLTIGLVKLFWEPVRMEPQPIHAILMLVFVQLDLPEISVNVEFARIAAQDMVKAIVVLATVILDISVMIVTRGL